MGTSEDPQAPGVQTTVGGCATLWYPHTLPYDGVGGVSGSPSGVPLVPPSPWVCWGLAMAVLVGARSRERPGGASVYPL